MSKFNKPSGSFGGKRKPSFGAKSKPARRGEESSEREEKKETYKSKRSFSKNKTFRKDGPSKREGFSDKPYKKDGGFSSDRKKSFDGGFKENRTGSSGKSFKKDPGSTYKKKTEKFGERDFKKERNFDDSKPFDRKKSRDGGFKEKRSFDKPYKKDSDSSFKKSDRYGDKKERNFDDSKPKRSFDKPFKRDSDSSFKKNDKYGDKKFGDRGDKKERSFDDSKSYDRKRSNDGGFKEKRSFDKPFKRDSDSSFKKKDGNGDKKERSYNDSKSSDRKFSKGKFDKDNSYGHKRVKSEDFEEGKSFTGHKKEYDERRFDKKNSGKKKSENADGLTRLNKYLSNAGIASRREADLLIQSGVVKVNGVVVDEMGFKVKPGDTVTYNDSSIKSERKVYLLLNKPKDYITTVDDPQERKTVMELIEDACRERVYPVGRLDRNTTGLLLFTNDGELTKKLTHPKHEIKKVYHVSLNKGLKPDDFAAITEGIELEDGIIKADDLGFVGEGKKEIGIEIHSGRNRIVRRIFEHLGYEVLKLDRVTFAGLTKKDLPRGKYRFLTPKEVNFLQMIG